MDRPQFLLGVLAVSAAATPAAAAEPPGATREDLAIANRVLAHEGVVDGFGHVSVRDPANASRYWLARSMAPALVTAADVLTYDLESTPLDANGATSYLERFIHGAIYKARPDVQSVVHAHTPAVIPFGPARRRRAADGFGEVLDRRRSAACHADAGWSCRAHVGSVETRGEPLASR
jgi:HCOMODA/2-hydroxy-3-carboxy-muconic semialdehyde decarboxylase